MKWNESLVSANNPRKSKHPRDNEGKFTFKNGSDGVIRGGIEETVEIDNKEDASDTDNKGEILIDALKTVLEGMEAYFNLKRGNVNSGNIFSTNNNINKESKVNDIKLNTYTPNSSNTKSNHTIPRETNINSADKINNPNKLKLGFGVLQPKSQRKIEDILYPTMKGIKNSNDRYEAIDDYDIEQGIDAKYNKQKTVEKSIEDILYPTMKNLSTKKTFDLSDNGKLSTTEHTEFNKSDFDNSNNIGSWIMPCQGRIVGEYKE